MSNNNEISSFIWSVCDDVLRGLFKQHEYGDVILPFVVLRRLDCVLEGKKDEIFFPGVVRHPVYPDANYSIVISRSGGWLFVKLFLGSFLAFIISWIVFLIPNKEFDSRISLTVGGIFGAIGNRYFVDSTIPAVQVLTKADMINNMIFALLILNVLIVIVQRNDKINFGLLEKNNFAMMFTGFAFIISNTLIILW